MKNRGMGLKKSRSLNLVLWFFFSVFALLVVLVYALLQNGLFARQYREQMARELTEAGEAILLILAAEPEVGADTTGSRVYEISTEAGVIVYVLREDGKSVFSPFGETLDYPQLASALKEGLAGNTCAMLTFDGYLAYASETEVEGRVCYLAVMRTTQSLERLTAGEWWVSAISAVFAVVLAFAASGLLAAVITKPVTEVTERAKELARGKFDLDFRQEYYCTEINELSEALDHARIEISKADKMQKELIANVSHDFRTPLTMIRAYASMIREISGEDAEKREKHTQVIIDEADRLSNLVEDLLDLSRLRAGIAQEDRIIFNLSEEVYRIAGRFEFLRETLGYSIETEVEEELYVEADRGRIEQVLYNLIGNAVNYTGEDRRVRVRLLSTESGSRFEVIDSGRGIPPEETETIWDRYYRSGDTHKRPVRGTGLGLSIVKQILLSQDFPFGVISEVGKGSCFWVDFPSPPTHFEGMGEEKSGGTA